ncbi:MAG: PorT family protein [Bacteroidales bacterium]|nr:PorT family protein [Bacteroidales bacterium]
MRKTMLLLLLTALIISMANPVTAQRNDKRKRTNFFQVGYNNSSLKSSGNSFGNSKGSFYFSLYKEIKIMPFIHFGSGLEYVKNGSYISDESKMIYFADGEILPTDDYVYLNYLTIPLHLTAKLGPVAGMVGVSGSYRVDARLINDEENRKLTDKSYFNRLDAGAYVGARLTIIFVGIEVRYTWGLVNVIDNYKNQNLQIGLYVAL